MNILYPPFATYCEGAASIWDYIREGECNQPLHIVVRQIISKKTI